MLTIDTQQLRRPLPVYSERHTSFRRQPQHRRALFQLHSPRYEQRSGQSCSILFSYSSYSIYVDSWSANCGLSLSPSCELEHASDVDCRKTGGARYVEQRAYLYHLHHVVLDFNHCCAGDLDAACSIPDHLVVDIDNGGSGDDHTACVHL
jgi:hypothetical protein